jgi:hypothetical protein
MSKPICFLNEIGPLFGGHSVMKEGEIDEPVNQICHKDGETHGREISSVEQLKGKHKPGSYILPLDDYRQIYVCTPELKLMAQKGEFICSSMEHCPMVAFLTDPVFRAMTGTLLSMATLTPFTM